MNIHFDERRPICYLHLWTDESCFLHFDLDVILPPALLLAQTGKTTETHYHLHFRFCCLREAVLLRVNKHRKPGDGPNIGRTMKTTLDPEGPSARRHTLSMLQAGMGSPKT